MEHAKRGRDKVPKSNMGSSILPLPKSGWIKLNVDGAMDSSMGCELLSWQWSVEIKHVPREANQVVDFVAKHFNQRPYELQMLEGPVAGSWKLPMEDLELAECLTQASIVEHYNDGILMGRALAESEPEFQNSNYGMIPAKESLFKEMLKTVRIEAGDEEDCMICLEELEVGFDASRMPCSHTFHGDCIEKWLRQSHYCPICRFEMPAN
ncbi:E3 ubiquitin-protein ligase MPSR1 [Gossypium hirsutum]|uniref:RING-type E3 ubiquitin transferase n=1 Tax=Gossypium hirsutum TaxID=3635 RepID=A0ABM2ZDB7_GOSHI|nr:E3 ubiquitin-protein ligase MPSR1-like [Gossypium hirsutum]